MIILKVLILGGTAFLGPHLVEELYQRGHQVTLFNRGHRFLSQYPEVERLQGDRDGDLEALKNRTWDAIIDTSGYLPRIMTTSSEMLKNATEHYIFISTVGVYANFYRLDINEEYPLAKLEYPIEKITEKTYGALKANCEQVVQNYFPDKTLIVRSGLIVGPGDPTDRFSYWPRRMQEGGELLAPGDASQNIQCIDVRDLATWIIDQVERRTTGIYNVIGQPIAFQELLTECQQITKIDATIHWVNENFLIEHQVQDWVELPLWLSKQRNMPGFFNINVQKATAAGLTTRPIADTITSILEWDAEHAHIRPQTSLNHEKEQYLLQAWQVEQ